MTRVVDPVRNVAPVMASPAPLPPATPAPAAAASSDDTKVWILRVARGVVLFVYAVVIVHLVMLTMGFSLRLFGASTDAPFTRWVYRNVDRIMEPFRGIFPSQPLSERSVLDTSLLFAMIVYGIVALFLRAGLDWITRWIARRRYELAVEEAQAAQAPPYAAPGPVATPAQPAATTRYPDVVVPATEPRPGPTP